MLDTQELPIDGLTPYVNNPRRGNVDLVMQSLRINGQYRAIVVNRGTATGRPMEVLAGNHTMEAAKRLGWDSITAHLVDLDEEAAKRVVLVDNRTNDVATYDNHELLSLLETVPNLEGTGYDADGLTALFDSMQEGAPGSADLVDAPEDDDYVEQWAVTVMCKDAAEQERIYRELTAKGLNCRVVTV